MQSTIPKKTKTKFFLLTSLIILIILVPIFHLAAQDKYGLYNAANRAGLIGRTGEDALPILIGNIIYAILGLLGIVFFILILYGGFMWMTARGNKDQVSKAQDIITSAAIGLAVVLASYAAASFILSKVLESSGIQNSSTPTTTSTTI